MATKLSKTPAYGGMHTSGIFSDMTVDGPVVGTLVAVIDRAKNLPNRRSMGKQDPYCAARLGKEAKKTATDKRGGQTPRWDQELRFTVHDSPDYHQLKVSVFNDDKKTELIGETYVNLENVITPGGGQSDTWHGLSCKGKYAGEIRIELTYYDTRPKTEKTPAEKRKESTRPEGQATVGGPRENTPVKRRPLPSDPTGASPSPVHTPEHRGLQGAHAGPREYRSSRQLRGSQPETPQRRPLPDASPLNGTPNSSHQTPQKQTHASRQAYSTPPNQRTQSAESFDMSYTAPKPYEVQPVDPVPQHPRDPGQRTMSQVDYSPSHKHSQSHLVEHPHSHSAPIVPTQQTYEPEPARHEPYAQSADNYAQSTYQDPAYQVEPLKTSRGPNRKSQAVPFEPQQAPNGYTGSPSPCDDFSFQGRRVSAMQPTVEDEDDLPPPPPVHRPNASTLPQHPQQSPPGYQNDTPAPLNVTRYREEPMNGGYDAPPQLHGMNDYAYQHPTERRYTHPRAAPQPNNRPVSRDTMVPSPLRNESAVIPASLVAGFDSSRQSQEMTSYQAPPPSYETPPRHRQYSEPDWRTSQFETASRPHPLAHQQSAPPAESPYYYPHAPPEEPRRTSPVQDPMPIVKPRAISPSTSPGYSQSPADNRASRAPVRSMPTRKSVSPRPPPSGGDSGERRLSGVPFAPDSFDVLNPSLAKPSDNAPSEPERPGSSMEVNDKGQVVTFSGRVIDASDHLPVDSWAPEPERKGAEKERPTRSRPVLNGSRDLDAAKQREEKYRRDRTERDRIRAAANVTFGSAASPSNALVPSRHEFNEHNAPAPPSSSSGALVLADRDAIPPSSSGRNRLRKRSQRPLTMYDQQSPPPLQQQHSSPANIPQPNPHVLRERENVGGYGHGARHSVAGPPIPAKIPLEDGGGIERGMQEDMSALSMELQRIDIGPGSGGGGRRAGRGGATARKYGF